MLSAQRSPAASQRATAPLLATNGAAVLGRKQLAGNSKSKGAVNPKGKQARWLRIRLRVKAGELYRCLSCIRSNGVFSEVSLAPPALTLTLLPHIPPRQPATSEPQ